jgi:hypothetical protein
MMDDDNAMTSTVYGAKPQTDWYAWRAAHRIQVGFTGSDGDQGAWQYLLKRVGPDRLQKAYEQVRLQISDDKRVTYANVIDVLEQKPVGKPDVPLPPASRPREDKLILCICMGGDYYAREVAFAGIIPNAAPEERESSIGGKVKVLPCTYNATKEQMEGYARKAEEARLVLSEQTGIPCAKWYPLSESVIRQPRLRAYLRMQRLLPAEDTQP